MPKRHLRPCGLLLGVMVALADHHVMSFSCDVIQPSWQAHLKIAQGQLLRDHFVIPEVFEENLLHHIGMTDSSLLFATSP